MKINLELERLLKTATLKRAEIDLILPWFEGYPTEDRTKILVLADLWTSWMLRDILLLAGSIPDTLPESEQKEKLLELVESALRSEPTQDAFYLHAFNCIDPSGETSFQLLDSISPMDRELMEHTQAFRAKLEARRSVFNTLNTDDNPRRGQETLDFLVLLERRWIQYLRLKAQDVDIDVNIEGIALQSIIFNAIRSMQVGHEMAQEIMKDPTALAKIARLLYTGKAPHHAQN